MKWKMKWNLISVIAFFLSSLSLVFIPFLDLEEEDLPPAAYGIAAVFWAGLLMGIILQIVVRRKMKKRKSENIRLERILEILMIVFLLGLICILLFWKESIVLLSIDLACLLFSIEFFASMRWRYRYEEKD